MIFFKLRYAFLYSDKNIAVFNARRNDKGHNKVAITGL